MPANEPLILENEFTCGELDALRSLAEKQEMTRAQTLRQALRIYQMVTLGHAKLEMPPSDKAPRQCGVDFPHGPDAEGEACMWCGKVLKPSPPPASDTDAMLSELERLWKATTKGEWLRNNNQTPGRGLGICEMNPGWNPDHTSVVCPTGKPSHGMHHRNAAFIAASHNHFPAILDLVRRLREENSELEEVVVHCGLFSGRKEIEEWSAEQRQLRADNIRLREQVAELQRERGEKS